MAAVAMLIRPDTPVRPPESHRDGAVMHVLAHTGGPLRVLGGPGTGKTTLAAHLVADRILYRNVDPEQILLLTTGRRAATALRQRIVELLADGAATVRTLREPLVRTVHSYAFGVLRRHAALHELPAPRLLSGPEQDVVIRDLLAGDIEAGARNWPTRLRPALGLPAFAGELRDLLMRAAERGLGPEDLVTLGREHGCDEWVAAGRFFRSYEQVTVLREAGGTGAAHVVAPALDAAELVGEALLTLDTDARLRTRERDRVRHLLVDDAQHLDPQQGRLVNRLAAGADETVLFADPDQTVFSFRGADARLLTEGETPTVRLGTDHRCQPAVRAAARRLAERLPGRARPMHGPEPEPEPNGTVTVRVFASAAAEAAWVADELRRAHLLGDTPWSRMAVVVRSTARALPPLRRALLAAGVPVTVPRNELPLARQGAVAILLMLLRCAVRPADLDEEAAADLLSSPVGGADPLALRRLRRELRRLELAAGGRRPSGDLLVQALRDADPLAVLDDRTARPAREVAGLLGTAARAADAGLSAEEVLWAVWQATGLPKRWADAAERGGAPGAQADRDLDAVVALFDAAARYTDRLPGADGGRAGVLGFCDYVADQRIPGDSLAPRAPRGETVEVLTAHAAAGREWDLVAVPGVQEGAWPDLRSRGSLLGVERLVDVVSGSDPHAPVSPTAPLLAEERRLMLVATTRARTTLLVSAVHGDDEQPSRFLDELGGTDTDPEAAARDAASPGRGLALPDLVAELRRAVTDDGAEPATRQRAAAGLARLARAGVPGADPDSWYGNGDVSSAAPLRDPAEPARVSPSTVELITTCPLRWLLTRHGGQDATTLPAVSGQLVHGLARAAAAGATDAELEAALDRAWAGVDAGAPWFSRREQRRLSEMLAAFRTWLARTRGELTQVATEQPVEVTLPGNVRLAGRVDRLERDQQARPVIVDVKTSKTPVTRQQAAEHAQLAAYQVAAAHGAFAEFGLDPEPGGARIVQVTHATPERTQPALDPDTVAHWLSVVTDAARRGAGPEFTAVENADCQRCPARTACPLHDSGRQVTQP